jgi:hypothetical protein
MMAARTVRGTRATRTVVAALATAGLVGALTAAPASAAPAEPEMFCDVAGQELAISPIAGLQDGDRVTWLSTIKGTTPTGFTGEYIGKLDNGLGLDAEGNPRDLLLVRLDGDLVNGTSSSLATGVWSGASGSPVYDEDGALVGAVSYGFSFLPDNVAGVTPAAYMRMMGQLPEARTLSPSARKEAARMAEEPATSSTSAIRRLEPVRVTTGATAAELDDATRLIASRVDGFRGVTASGRATASAVTDGADFPIVAGGNIAVSYAHGAVGEASVGTVTAVCGDEVFAYGHPNNWNSDLSASIHGASAARIVPDLTGSYKLISAIGRVKGTLAEDRLVGIRGVLGAGPEVVRVQSTSRLGSKRSTVASSVSEAELIPAVAYTQASNEAVRMLDNVQVGSARVRWTIRFEREDGTVGELDNENRYADRYDFPSAVGMNIADDIAILQSNPFEEVKVTAVHIGTVFEEGYRAARLAGVQMKKNGVWSTIPQDGKLTATRGKTYAFRAVFAPVRGAERVTRYLEFNATVPRTAKRGLRVSVAVPAVDEESMIDPELMRSFDQLVAALDANTRTDVIERTHVSTSTKGVRTSRTAVQAVPVVLADPGSMVTFGLYVTPAR